jgi:hypothetical protein
MGMLLATVALAQQATVSTRTYDVNGRPVEGVATTQSGGSQSKVTRNANGREVPVESVEERVISDAGGVKIVERSVKRYDANGVPGPPERIRIEERKESDGSLRISSTTLRGDINGAFQIAERSTTIARTSGGRTDTTTAIERPTLNGSMDVVERSEQSTVVSGPKTTENVTTLRRDSNGRLTEFAKKTKEVVASNGHLDENVAEYESAATGQMRLMRQTTAKVDPGGTRQVNLFLPDAEGKPTLSQQQVIEKRETPNGTVETTTVRLASPNDPGKLGPARKVEETVCTGNCGRKP